MTHRGRNSGAMASPPAGGTLILPQRGGRTSGSRDSERELPDDLLRQAASRLHILALLYAFVFFMADYFPNVLFPERRAEHLSRPILWAPGVIAIAVALLVAAIARKPRMSLPAVMNIGLAFEIVGSYGIAASEFLGMMGQKPSHTWFGLSWVSVWTLLFTVVVPTPPRRAVVAALASVSAVPAIAGFVLGAEPGIFFWLVFPYLLVVVMAYVGARVVYALGAEISRTRELGSYRLVERLGQGGMGEVWRAQHRMLARPAAIKLIRPSLTADARSGTTMEMRRRFEREAQVIASLRSPHTVNLFDFGVATDGAFYYVMELLEGLDAETLVRRFGPLPHERVIHVLRQVCHSLSEADARGLVHRDIKPANIFLCHYGEEFDFVKVLDFGLVTALHDVDDGADIAITREHSIQGTPAFIAPEQALGRGKVDGRADVYAAGCVTYWLLTGHLVFTADTAMALLMEHVHAAPAPPSTRIEDRIPAALDQLVLACLAKNPADRPSAKDLSRRLAEIDGADAWTEAAAQKWWTTHHPLADSSERIGSASPG